LSICFSLVIQQDICEDRILLSLLTFKFNSIYDDMLKSW